MGISNLSEINESNSDLIIEDPLTSAMQINADDLNAKFYALNLKAELLAQQQNPQVSSILISSPADTLAASNFDNNQSLGQTFTVLQDITITAINLSVFYSDSFGAPAGDISVEIYSGGDNSNPEGLLVGTATPLTIDSNWQGQGKVDISLDFPNAVSIASGTYYYFKISINNAVNATGLSFSTGTGYADGRYVYNGSVFTSSPIDVAFDIVGY